MTVFFFHLPLSPQNKRNQNSQNEALFSGTFCFCVNQEDDNSRHSETSSALFGFHFIHTRTVSECAVIIHFFVFSPFFHFLYVSPPPDGHVTSYSFTTQFKCDFLESILMFLVWVTIPLIRYLYYSFSSVVVIVCDHHMERETCSMYPQKLSKALTLLRLHKHL